MKLIQSLIIVLAVYLMTACSGITVSQDYDKTADFMALQTFGWKPRADVEHGDPTEMSGFVVILADGYARTGCHQGNRKNYY